MTNKELVDTALDMLDIGLIKAIVIEDGVMRLEGGVAEDRGGGVR